MTVLSRTDKINLGNLGPFMSLLQLLCAAESEEADDCFSGAEFELVGMVVTDADVGPVDPEFDGGVGNFNFSFSLPGLFSG